MEDTIEKILTTYRTWAVVGCSPNTERDSHQIAAFLKDAGYRVIPVNAVAGGQEILGEHCYASLHDIPAGEGVEVVNIFRRSEDAGVHVDEAIDIGAKAVWMQRGVIDEDAAERARAAGLDVVMDRSARTELKNRRARTEQAGS
jgi:predicted CoA-binding protein